MINKYATSRCARSLPIEELSNPNNDPRRGAIGRKGLLQLEGDQARKAFQDGSHKEILTIVAPQTLRLASRISELEGPACQHSCSCLKTHVCTVLYASHGVGAFLSPVLATVVSTPSHSGCPEPQQARFRCLRPSPVFALRAARLQKCVVHPQGYALDGSHGRTSYYGCDSH